MQRAVYAYVLSATPTFHYKMNEWYREHKLEAPFLEDTIALKNQKLRIDKKKYFSA